VDLYRPEVRYVAKTNIFRQFLSCDSSTGVERTWRAQSRGGQRCCSSMGSGAQEDAKSARLARALGLQTKLCITTTLPTLLHGTTRRASSSRSVNSMVMPTAHSNPGLILTRNQSCEAAADLGIGNSHDLARRSAYDLQEPPDTATTRSCA
jgi:hypothetical protein